MYRQLLCAAVLCLLFSNAWSIQCYLGSDGQCLLPPDMNDCKLGETCLCAKYRYKCTADDLGCTQYEVLAGYTTWGYAKVNKEMCDVMRRYSSTYLDATCCAEDRCNQPNNGKCSYFQYRR